jgi:hypothetical protein
MIYCSDRKIAIFYNPKTGTRTINEIFKNHIPVTLRTPAHANYTIAKESYDVSDFDSYKFYTFYRDPVKRFDSAYKFYKRFMFQNAFVTFFDDEHWRQAEQQLMKEKFDRFMPMNRKDYNILSQVARNEYFWLSEELRNKIESITVEKLLEKFTYEFINSSPSPDDVLVKKVFQKTPGLFLNQRFWCHHNIDMELLDFADFDNQLKMICSKFGYSLNEVPVLNGYIPVENDHILTQDEVEMIKHYYKLDYEFFASKGITF